MTQPVEPHLEYPRKVLLIPGTPDTGAPVLARIVELLGLRLPDAVFDESLGETDTPPGFDDHAVESEWVHGFHKELLGRAEVAVRDARPGAWYEIGKVTARDEKRGAAADFLEQGFANTSELVLRDSSMSWFLGLWRIAAVRASATPVFATVLRHPAAVIGARLDTKAGAGAGPHGAGHLAASWLNTMLHVERSTRESAAGGGRAFVDLAALTGDWTNVTKHLADRLELNHVMHAAPPLMREVHHLTPELAAWAPTGEESLEGLGLPARLRELIEETWTGLSAMVDPAEDTPTAQAHLDEIREAYVDTYAEAEAMVWSSAAAAKLRGRREMRRKLKAEQAEQSGQTGNPAGAGTDDSAGSADPANPVAQIRERARQTLGRLR